MSSTHHPLASPTAATATVRPSAQSSPSAGQPQPPAASASTAAAFADEGEGDDNDTGNDEQDSGVTAASDASSSSDAAAVASAIVGPAAPAVAAAGFSRWMCCFACITFDLTLGPSLEAIYPPGQLTPDEVTNLCSLSFPDSHCASLGDEAFCFRMRMQTERNAILEAAAAAAAKETADTERTRASSGGGPSSAAAPAAAAAAPGDAALLHNKYVRSHLKFLSDNQSLMFGYVLFRQRRDDSNARGFFQKSIVLLSPLPAVEAFTQITAIVGRAFFDFGPSVFEVAAQQVAAWPIPYPGRRINLPLLGESISQLQLPYYSPLSPMASAHSTFERQQQFGSRAAAAAAATAAPRTAAAGASTASAPSSGSAFTFGSSAPSSPEPIRSAASGGAEPSRSRSSNDDSANSSAPSSRSASLSSSPVESAASSTAAASTAAAGSSLAVPAAAAATAPMEPSSAGVQGSSHHLRPNPLAKPALVHSVSDSTGSMARLALSRTTGSPPMHPRPTMSPLPASHSASNAAGGVGMMSPPPSLSLSSPSHHSPGVGHGSTSAAAHGWFQNVPLYSAFSRSQVANLWYCWELVLSGEAILVVAPTPSACSQVVLGLVSLISPIVYRGDYRPYFTIYDSDYRYYSQLHDLGKLNSAPVILGVTNPFFLKTMERFPNVICFGADGDSAAAAAAAAAVANEGAESGSSGGAGGSPTASTAPSSGGSGSHATTRISSKFNSAIDVLHIASAPSQFVSNSTPLLTPDEITIKRLRDIPSSSSAAAAADARSTAGADRASGASPASGSSSKPSVYSEEEQAYYLSGNHRFLYDINNALLRRYFQSLTHLFLSPFMPFITFTPEQQKLYTERRWFPYSAPTNMPTIYGAGTPVSVSVSAAAGAAGSSPVLGPISSSSPSSSAAAMMGSSPSSKATPFALSASAAAAVGGSSPASAGLGHGHSGSSPLNVPALPRFAEEDFLSRVIGNLTSAQLALFPLSGLGVSQRRAKLQRLYEKFIRSVNFPPWFHEARERANAQIGVLIAQEIRRLHRAGDAAFLRFMDGIKVSEAIEMVKRATAMLEHTMHTPSFVTHNNSSSGASGSSNDPTATAAAAASPAAPGSSSSSSSSAAVYTTDVDLQHAIQHHLQLMHSVIPQSQMAKLLAWQSERHALLPDSKKKRLAHSLPTASPPASDAATAAAGSPLRASPPLPSSSPALAAAAAASRSPPQQTMQQQRSSTSAQSTPQRSPLPPPTRAAPAAHPHPPHALADARSSRGSASSFDSPTGSGSVLGSSGRSRTGRGHGGSVGGLLSSPEARTADIVVVQKQPMQMTISDDYF